MNFTNSLTLQEFKTLIKEVGQDVTFIGAATPGIGKSAMLAELINEMPEYEPAYIDCTLLDLGDFALPYTEQVEKLKVTLFAPNARFGFQHDRPVLVMLDEIGKAMRSVKNVLLTLMLEHRIGDVYLPEGSIVFGTTNLTTDGVGDSMEAHARNRVCFVHLKKPHAGFNADGTVDKDSWGAWALNHDIDPIVLAWVREFPQCLACYTEGEEQKDNPYIFNPTRAGQTAFVSPRSLEKASHIVKKRATVGNRPTLIALAGTIGEAAARDMQAFMQMSDALVGWDVIVKSPEEAPVPDEVAPRVMLTLRALTLVDKDTLAPWMVYLKRMDAELQAMFCRSLIMGSKQKLATSSKAFVDWAIENNWLVA